MDQLSAFFLYPNFMLNMFFLSFQVEVWLNRVMEAMRSTVRHELSESVVAYEEKARDQWLFDYPAQVSICRSYMTGNRWGWKAYLVWVIVQYEKGIT